MTRTDGEDEPESPLGLLNGKPIQGPERPPVYVNNNSPGWSFAGLDNSAPADEGNTDKAREDPSDNGSMMAERDGDSAIGGDDTDYQGRIELLEHDEDYDTRGMSGPAGAGTPDVEMDMRGGQYDNDDTFGSAYHQGMDDEATLHLEDAGMIGDPLHSPPVVDIFNDEMEGVEALTVTREKDY